MIFPLTGAFFVGMLIGWVGCKIYDKVTANNSNSNPNPNPSPDPGGGSSSSDN